MAKEMTEKYLPKEIAGADKCDNLDHKTAKCCVPPHIELKVLDCVSKSPVKDALLRSIDITCEDNVWGRNWINNSLNFDFSWPVEYKSEFTERLEKELQDVRGKLDAARFDAVYWGQFGFPRAEAELIKAENLQAKYSNRLGELLRHRDVRRNWVRHLQYLLLLNDAWEGDIDGLEGKGFQTRVNKAWEKVIEGSKRPKEPEAMIKALYNRLEGTRITDNWGIVKVPLPIKERGTAKIEMAHLKMIDPDKAKEFMLDFNPCVIFDKARENADDDPQKRNPLPSKESRWTLVVKNENGRKAASFQNYIEVRFDTTGENSKHTCFPATTLALMWCQPAWTPVGEKDWVWTEGPNERWCQPAWTPVVGKDWVWTEGPNESLNDGRGLENNQPTLLVSSLIGASGKAYGIYGRARTEDPPAWGKLVKQFGKDWVAWANNWKLRDVYSSQNEAEDYISHLKEPERSAMKLIEVPLSITPIMWQLMAFHGVPLEPKLVYGSLEGPFKLPPFRPLEMGKQRNEPTYRLEIRELKLRWEFTEGEPRYQVWRREYTTWETKELAEQQVANQSTDEKQIIEAVDKQGRLGRKVCWTKATTLELMYSEVIMEFGKVKEVFQHRMHMGIDVAGKVGDPVFAPVGGVVQRLSEKGDGGKTVRIKPWIKNCDVDFIILHHNDKFSCKETIPLKAGDQVALMGRTGNPNWGSPSHVHFWSGKNGQITNFTEKVSPNVMPGYSVVFPHNHLPVLLPCAGEYGKRGNPPHPAEHDPVRQGDLKNNPNSYRSYPNMCRAKTGDTKDIVFKDCWAYKEKTCPNAYRNGELIGPQFA